MFIVAVHLELRELETELRKGAELGGELIRLLWRAKSRFET